MNVEDNIYPWYLQTLLNDSRLAGTSCDVILVIEDTELKAHRTVLSAASPYFCTMFNSVAEFKESKSERITLHDVDSESVTAILEFIYTSKIRITEKNVFHLMDTSNLFQIYSLRIWISNFLLSTLSVENCLSLYVKATFYNYYDLAQTTLNFIKKNFSQVVDKEEFLELPGNVLSNLLSSKFLNVANEYFLVKCIMKWINFDADIRKDYAIELISKIELTSIPVQRLVELKNEPAFKKTLPNKIQEFLNQQIAKWYDSYTGASESPLKWETVRYGSEQGVIIAIGGEAGGLTSKNSECFTFGYEAWKCVIPQYVISSKGPQNMSVIPAMNCPRSNAGVAYDSYNVYVLGGKSSNNYLDHCETFNIRSCKWTCFKNIPEKLEGGSAVIFEGRLVFIGGRNELGTTAQAWEWDSTNNIWKSFPPLNYARSFHCTISFGGYIYALGGFESDQETALRIGERYDPSLKKWFEIRGMQKARARFGCAAINDNIYVMGGVDRNCGLMSVERYSFETNEWSYMAPMLVPRHSFSVAVCEKKIFCIGGSDTIHVLHSVDKFNPMTNRWHFLLSMQMCRCGLASATLLVPHLSRHV